MILKKTSHQLARKLLALVALRNKPPSLDAKVCDECGVRTAFEAPGFAHAATCSEVTGRQEHQLTIEKLTDDDRRELLRTVPAYEERERAVALIDALTSKCDAQAAVIERLAFRLLEALAAATEHTAPGESQLVRQLRASFASQCEVVTERVRDLDAANARVAELERLCTGYRQTAERECERADTANARADAAVQEAEKWKAAHGRALDEKWSEKTRADAAERSSRSWAQQHDERTEQLERAESEAAALRAEQSEFRAALKVAQKESDDMRAEVAAFEANLSTATELLESAAALSYSTEREAETGYCAAVATGDHVKANEILDELKAAEMRVITDVLPGSVRAEWPSIFREENRRFFQSVTADYANSTLTEWVETAHAPLCYQARLELARRMVTKLKEKVGK